MPDTQLFLIDAHALCYRSYYAIRDLTNSRGQATNAVYGFVTTVRKILKEYQPSYVGICFDVGAKTHRQEKFAAYKIQRPRMPDSLVSQIPLIKAVVEALRVPIFEAQGYEADDVIATMTKLFRDKGLEIVIVSDDKDMYQLVDKGIKILSMKKNAFLDREAIREHMGFDPQYIPDYIGLAGDATDNIPGVQGIGKVSACRLINEYGSIENMFEHLSNIKPSSLAEKIQEGRQDAMVSKELAILNDQVPLSVELSSLQVKEPDQERLYVLFNDLEFRRLAQEVQVDIDPAETLPVINLKSSQEMEGYLKIIRHAGQVGFYWQTAAEEQSDFLGKDFYLSCDGKSVYAISLDKLGAFRELWEDAGIEKITFDLKDKAKVMAHYGVKTPQGFFDCMLAGYLLSPTRTGSDLKALVWEHLECALPQGDMPRQTAAIFRLRQPLQKILEDKGLWRLFADIEMPLALVLTRMELEGVGVDLSRLGELSTHCDQKIKVILQDIFRLAGQEFNVNSPKQLSEILFQKLKLSAGKKTKTGLSTNEEVLRRLAMAHPLPAMILEYRQMAKLKSTYIDALPRLIDPQTGRIHTSFNQVGTETGRLSSNNPNLQNIPIRTELGREIRKCFVASGQDLVLVAADYSQIELRILAHLSQDLNLMKAFQQGEDIHNATASQIYGVNEADVTREMRYAVKRVNFGIIYGMSAFGLAKDLQVPQPQAQEFIDRYFMRYPRVKTFMDQAVKDCEEKGYVVTLLNRRRYIPEIHNQNLAIRQFAQRQAINTPVQGSAADLMKLAMIRIQKSLDDLKLPAKMIITVHDELVFEVFESQVQELIVLIRQNMEQALSLRVPVKVTVKKGRNWIDMEEVAGG
jgi:DNA polymerase-1